MDASDQQVTKQDQLLRALETGDVELFKRLLDDKEVRADFRYEKRGSCLEVACRDKIPNCEETIKLLLNKVKPNVHSLKPEPIHFAASRGNVTALKLLLSDKRTKVNAVNSEGLTPLHFAVRNFAKDVERYSQVLELLLACQNVDVNVPNKKGCTAIFEAAHAGCREAVVKILELRPVGLDLDAPRSRGRSARELILRNFPDLEPSLPSIKLSVRDVPLEQAHLLQELLNGRLGPFKSHLQLVDEEGNRVTDPNYVYVEPYPRTLLNEACTKEDLVKFVHVLLEAGADPNLVNGSVRRAPIHTAIFSSNLPAVEALIEQKPFNANVQDKSGNTPLHYIVRFVEDDRQALRLIDRLVELGADLKLTNQSKETAFVVAVSKGRSDVIRDRVNETRVTDEGKTTSNFRLFQYLYNGDSASFLKKLDESNGTALLDSSDGKNTLLQTACIVNMKEAVDKLLEKGADPNLTTKRNQDPPVIISASKRRDDILKSFLEHGSSRLDINKTDKKGNTALHVVARSQNFDMVVKLLQAGADISVKNNLGKEPISAPLLNQFLDNCLKTDTETYPEDERYVVKFNYEFLVARKATRGPEQSVRIDEETVTMRPSSQRTRVEPELKTLSYIVNTHSEIGIIKHPVITSFINVKWSRLRYLSYVNLIFTLLFTIILNLYIYLGCYLQTECSFTSIAILNLIISALLLLVIVRELVQMLASVSAYVRNVGNLLDLSMILFTTLTVFVPLDDVNATLIVTVLTVVTSTTSLMIVSGRLSRISKYIAILKKVIKNYLYMLVLYSMVLVSFSMCFYVLFRDTENDNFSNFFLALFKVIMMMSGDLSTDDIEFDPTSVISYLTFTAFGLIVVVVLFNLLTGLAVSDIQEIKEAALLLSIQSQVETMTEIEIVVLRLYGWLPVLSRFYSIDNLMVGSKTDVDARVYPNRSSKLLVGEKEVVQMNQDWLSRTMKIIGKRSTANNKLSVDERLFKIQKSLEELLSRLDAMGTKTVAEEKND